MTQKGVALTLTLFRTRLKATQQFVVLIRTLEDAITHVVQVHTHLRLPAPVVARTGVRVTVQLVHIANTVFHAVTSHKIR